MKARERAAQIVQQPVTARKLIEKAMIDQDIARREDLAALIGMPISTFNLHMRDGRWTIAQMARLFSVLGMGPAEAAIVLGVNK